MDRSPSPYLRWSVRPWLARRGGTDGCPAVLPYAPGDGRPSLLAAGLEIVAVEPLAECAIPLPGASLDGAVCGEALHWFDGERAAAELHRVLRPDGGLVLAWLVNEGDEGPWTREVLAILRPLWERASHPSIIEGRHGTGEEPTRRRWRAAPWATRRR